MANENVIPAGLPGYVMRKRIEDKATLHKGGMYVGTGEYETITDKKGNEYKVYKTEELPAGKEDQILMSTVNGIKWEDPQNIILNCAQSRTAFNAESCFFSDKAEWKTGKDELVNYLNDTSDLSKTLNIQIVIQDKDNAAIYDLGFLHVVPRQIDNSYFIFYDSSSNIQCSTYVVNNLVLTVVGKPTNAVPASSNILIVIQTVRILQLQELGWQDVTDKYQLQWKIAV